MTSRRSGPGLGHALACETYEVATAADAVEALESVRARPPHLILQDLRMPGPLSGLDLIRHVKDERPETLLIVVTAHGSIETAVEAMRLGAHDYVTKPVNLGVLRLQVRHAFEHHRLREENRRLRDRLALSAASPLSEIVGRGAAMTELLGQIAQIADTDVTVMIEGESGTGKELIARSLHDAGTRRSGPFIAANVGALPESLVESELFGYEKGAFSGADRQKPGWFEMARGGTLFLDEVAEMAPKTQVDLLRVLEQRELRRLGGEGLIPLDVRVVAATNRDVDELLADGRMRTDLYYRLSVVRLRVPPLRERRDDIPQLVQHFIEQAALRHHREIKRHRRRGDAHPPRPPMAGERPPAPQRRRAARRYRRGTDHPIWATCRPKSSPNPPAATTTSPSTTPSPRRIHRHPRRAGPLQSAPRADGGCWTSAYAPCITR